MTQGIVRMNAGRRRLKILALGTLLLWGTAAQAETLPSKGKVDTRVRETFYNSQEVYRLHGYVGYQIDLQFETGESFVGLGAGDIDGLAFLSQDNHLFIKPKAARIKTNFTVLTDRRFYQFDYTASNQVPDPGNMDVIYALRFTYPAIPRPSGPSEAERIDASLEKAGNSRVQNYNYWYCGRSSIQPVAASDDGVHTRLRFGARAELPAIYVGTEEGGESLLNFSIEDGDVVIHRVAPKFILRRGKITGCIVNKGFSGGGERLKSGTVAPDVVRTAPGVRP